MPGDSVECYSGYTYGERPTALTWDGARLTVVAVEQAARIPGGRRFRVRTEDGRVFELEYTASYDEWRVHLA
jgi:hypothetical protein